MSQRNSRFWVVLAVATLLAPMVGAAAARADIIPPTATTNSITIAIGRPNVIYHDGQVVHYTVSIAVPSIIVGGVETVGQVKDITSSATLPNGVVAPLPFIPVLNPGTSMTFTAADQPLLDYTIVHADETVAPLDGHHEIVATGTCDGLSQVSEGAGEPAHADVQITTHVWHPNTGVTIQAVPAFVVAGAGQTVDLIVTETNTGDMNDPGLDQVSVVVNNGAVDIATLVAPPDSGDDGNGILKGSNTVDLVPETWTWTIHNVPVSATTTFTATGSGRERFGALIGNVITYPGFPTERAQVTVQALSTIVDISSSASSVVSGGSVNLTITETNNGSAALSNVSVAVLKNGAAFATLVAPPNSGDTGNDGILGVGETWSWTIPSGAITASTTFQATGSGQADGVVVTYPADPEERDSVTVGVVSTVTTIASSATSVSSGGTVNLTITETNDGAAALTSPQVVVTMNGAPLATLVAPPDSGDTGNDGILGVGETWTWTIPSGAITVNPTVFEAIGSGVAPDGTVVTYPGDPDERDVVTVSVTTGEATRTPGFWKTHLAFTTAIFENELGGEMDICWRDITSIEDLMGIFWASNTRNSDGTKRDALCQARETVAFQVVAAILNTGLDNGKALPVSLADIQTIMCGTDIQAIRNLGSTLDAYNNSGDNVPIQSPWPIGNATPQAAKDIANIPYADCP